MRVRSVCLCVGLAGICLAEDNKPPSGQAANEAVQISATAHADKAAIRSLMGEEMEQGIVVVEVRVTPKDGKLKVHRDDFFLRSDKDGQSSQPYAPSQIAGRGALVVSTTGGGGPGVMSEDRGPVWGGIGGPPRRLGGDGGALGNAGDPGTAVATLHTGDHDKENPLLATLRAKELPEKETKEPVSGLLYFPLEGKHKTKQLELYYRGPAGKLSLRFK